MFKNKKHGFSLFAALVYGALFFSLSDMGLSAQETTSVRDSVPAERDLSIDRLLGDFDDLSDSTPSIELDSNGDGRTDYMIKTHIASGDKLMEALDYNHDGAMDDFYYYRDGILIERAIDSNYDRKVDLWVYIEEGIYIAYFERDTDYDGTMDELKRYAQNSVKE